MTTAPPPPHLAQHPDDHGVRATPRTGSAGAGRHRRGRPRASVLSWPAWQRLLAVAPLCLLLWLGVIWALAENQA